MKLTSENFMTEFKKWQNDREYKPFWLSDKNIHAFRRYENSICPPLKTIHRLINMRVQAKCRGFELQHLNKRFLDLYFNY